MLHILVVILKQLRYLTERVNLMATQQDLDTAIAGISSQLDTLSTDLTTAIADLEAKIAASGTPTDFTPELTSLQAIATKLTSATAAVTAADPGAPTSTTPAT